MEKDTLKQILKNFYKKSTIDAILRNSRKPNFDVMLELNQNYNIPFTAWKDIKSFLEDNNNKEKDKIKTPQGRDNSKIKVL